MVGRPYFTSNRYKMDWNKFFSMLSTSELSLFSFQYLDGNLRMSFYNSLFTVFLDHIVQCLKSKKRNLSAMRVTRFFSLLLQIMNVILILVDAAIFWGTGSPPKLGIPLESQFVPFRRNFLKLSALLFLFLSCMSMKHKNYKNNYEYNR